MAQTVTISEISKYNGQEVTIQGWLYNMRSSGKLRFLLVRDGSATIQCVVFKNDVSEEIFTNVDKLTQESSLRVTGKVAEDKRSPLGYELQVRDVDIVQIAEEYPISLKEHGVDFLMDHRHLWLRSRLQHAVMLVRHEVIRAAREFFDNRGFVLVDSPIFTPNAAEGTTTLFGTDYFGSKAYLTQSGQLYAEASAMAFGKVYCFGPTFRAEKSKTRRHLTEFWMIEPEAAYYDLNDDMKLAEDFVSHLVQSVVKNRRRELETLERDISKLEHIKPPFPRIHYNEAAEMVKKENPEFKVGDDFGGADETIVSEKFDKPVIIHHYPAAIKAFYMKRDPQEPQSALAMDIIAPEGYGEIIGGSQREDDYDTLLQRIKEHNLPEADFKWYLDLRKYGSVPHSGFGLGIERTVGWICGTKHVRETIPYPRLMQRIYP
ncbi:MAG: asparagine--tRNA ligase [Calditrichaceae bacterium]|nr:asparagine--tRNA ligase [Calditrichaceae bacterium]MBN2708795.1 asparagine--tRNA ligase [Calditrichaceae bacterium]RQV97675.1 MAG: asparagine--tRNA ligase [Calditrichota bacterium]